MVIFEETLVTDTDFNKWDHDHSWHPFTQMEEYLQCPQIQVDRGEGCWLWDIDGNRYLDTNASIWTNVHGHNDKDINEAIKNQLDKVAHSTYLGLSHTAGSELAHRLIPLAPSNLNRVFFSDNGSNAVEIALKLSFQYWQLVGQPEKKYAVSMEGGYHGDTFGAMSVSKNETFHGRFNNWCFPSFSFQAPNCIEVNGKVINENSSESLKALETLLKKESANIACLIMEPWIQGAAGMKLQPKGFLKKVADLCNVHNVHLILDEVFVGFGRTGNFFVCNEENVEPDFLCLAKGLTAGYIPMAATLTSEKIYQKFLGTFESFRAFFHGHTFTGNPLACAVALKNIEKLEHLIDHGHLSETIYQFGSLLEKFSGKHPNVREIRQRGLAAAIDLCPDKNKNENFPVSDRIGLKVCIEARKQGLLMRPLCDTLLIVPPLIINEEEMKYLFSNCVKAIDGVLK